MTEADAVVAIGNLARSLPTANGHQLQADLTCYARSVVNVEFPAIEAGNTSQPDDDSALLRLYHSVSSLRLGTQNEVATAQAVTQQLSTLTDARDRGSAPHGRPYRCCFGWWWPAEEPWSS